jgi:hypothetical protein
MKDCERNFSTAQHLTSSDARFTTTSCCEQTEALYVGLTIYCGVSRLLQTVYGSVTQMKAWPLPSIAFQLIIHLSSNHSTLPYPEVSKWRSAKWRKKKWWRTIQRCRAPVIQVTFIQPAVQLMVPSERHWTLWQPAVTLTASTRSGQNLETPKGRIQNYIYKNTNHQQIHKESSIINCNTLLHVSTLLGHLQGELSVVVTLRWHYTVERECAVDCVLCTGGVDCPRSAQSTAHSHSTVKCNRSVTVTESSPWRWPSRVETCRNVLRLMIKLSLYICWWLVFLYDIAHGHGTH